MRLSWFIAVQFLREYRVQAWLTMSAVSVGVAVMVFLSALITGLQTSLIKQTLGTQPHITVRAQEQPPRPQRLDRGVVRRTQQTPQKSESISEWQRVVRRVESVPGIVSVAPLVTGSAFAVRGNVNRPVVVMGADQAKFSRIIPLQDKLIAGRTRVAGGEVVIGTGLADDLGLFLGDKLRLTTPEGQEALLTVQGVFDLGNQQVNERWVVVPLRTGQALLGLPGSSNAIFLQVDKIFGAEAIAQELSANTGLAVESWMASNQQLLVALRSQSSSSYTIQFFVFLAVAMGISSVLVVSVVQRTREIGILRAMGVPRRSIFLVFVIQGALIGLLGSLMGCVLGAGLAQFFSRIAAAPDGSPTFPMALSPELFLVATLAATLTGIGAAALPARRAANLDPVEAMRRA